MLGFCVFLPELGRPLDFCCSTVPNSLWYGELWYKDHEVNHQILSEALIKSQVSNKARELEKKTPLQRNSSIWSFTTLQTAPTSYLRLFSCNGAFSTKSPLVFAVIKMEFALYQGKYKKMYYSPTRPQRMLPMKKILLA